MSESVLRLLVLHAAYTDRLSYYDDWLDAFRAHPRFQVEAFNIVPAGQEAALRDKLSNCDAVVILHSANGDTTVYLERYASTIGDRKVPLLSFVGNEVNLPGSPISEKRKVFSIIRPEWIATQLLEEAGDFLFGDLAQRCVVAIPHALNAAVFKSTAAPASRPVDIGTRAAHYLPHLGDDDRNRIIDVFRRDAARRNLTVDISDSRFGREGWVAFLNRCKGTVATEAGSWFIERDDATVNAIRRDVLGAKRGIVIANDSALRTLGHKMPWWMRAFLRRVMGSGFVRHEALVNEDVPFDDIFQKYFAGRPRPAIHGKCVSSRHFDAIGTKTCQIMFRGRFNDILQADVHYLALEDDFSNIDAVLERFRDGSERQKITETAHAHVLAAHTYEHRMGQVENLLREF